MDPLSSAISIAVFGGTVTTYLKDLIDSLVDAPDYINALEAQTATFSSALRNLVGVLKTSKADQSVVNGHAQDLVHAVKGGEVVLKQLKHDIVEMRSNKPMINSSGCVISSPKERTKWKWSESHIIRWKTELNTSCGTLTL